MEHVKVTLSNLANGSAEELFQREMQRVLENISDINTVAEAVRTITLKIKIKPSKDRSIGGAIINCSSNIANVEDKSVTFFFAKEKNSMVAYQKQEQQIELDMDNLNNFIIDEVNKQIINLKTGEIKE